MPLQPGIRLGPYEVTAAIGAGGMGELYRATDAQLKRDGALKVLPAALATDTDRLDRFQIVARVAAVGPNHYGMDLALPENAFRFRRHIPGAAATLTRHPAPTEENS